MLVLLLPRIAQERDDREQTRRGSREIERISRKADTAAGNPVGRRIFFYYIILIEVKFIFWAPPPPQRSLAVNSCNLNQTYYQYQIP